MKVKKVFLTGIGGIGMCGVAGILKELGFEVAGSEKDTLYPPASDVLNDLKVKVYPYNQENIKSFSPDAVIFGNAISKDHPEFLITKELGIPYFSFPEFLERFVFLQKKVLVCAGTHGKTTTTTLLAFLMEKLGLGPGYLIGGLPRNEIKNYSAGKGEWFVIEGDEYPSASFDRRAKFLHYAPFGAILTSIEHDHLDVYPEFKALKEVFKNFVELLPENGTLVYNSDDETVKEVILSSNCKAKLVSFGTSSEADFRLTRVKTGFINGRFETKVAFKYSQGEAEFTLPLLGKHNALNAISVIALLFSMGLMSKKDLHLFSKFPGVKRRQEVVYQDETLIVIDDFAHHPTAVKLTLSEIISAVNPEKTTVVFEPRTNSSKRRFFESDYVEALSIADVIILKKPPGLEKVPEEQRINIQNIIKRLKALGKEADILENRVKLLRNTKGLLVCMSSAYMGEVLDRFKGRL